MGGERKDLARAPRQVRHEDEDGDDGPGQGDHATDVGNQLDEHEHGDEEQHCPQREDL